MLTHLLRGLARSIIALTALSLIGLALTPLGQKISQQLQHTESRFSKDFKLSLPSDEGFQETHVLMLLMILNGAIKDLAISQKHRLSDNNIPVRKTPLEILRAAGPLDAIPPDKRSFGR